jgi:hypothetical protein
MKNSIKLTGLMILSGLLSVQVQAGGSRSKAHIKEGMNCVIVQHEVADFNKWEAAFKADANRRKKAGISDLYLFRGDSDTHSITAVFELNDITAAKAFFNDPATGRIMGAAGVTSKPVFTYFKVANSGVDKYPDVMIIRHKVADYDKWKKIFDEHESVRATYKIGLIAVGKDLDNSGYIVVIFNSPQASDFTDFLEKSDLKEVMKDAGVISQPVVDMLKTVN